MIRAPRCRPFFGKNSPNISVSTCSGPSSQYTMSAVSGPVHASISLYFSCTQTSLLMVLFQLLRLKFGNFQSFKMRSKACTQYCQLLSVDWRRCWLATYVEFARCAKFDVMLNLVFRANAKWCIRERNRCSILIYT